MSVQIGMAIIANVLVLGIALLVLSFLPIPWQSWSVAAGWPLGWIALVLPLAALQLRGRLRPHAVGLSGMAVLGLLACTIGGLYAQLALGHRSPLGLSHADARLGRLCLAGRGGHLVGCVAANHGR